MKAIKTKEVVEMRRMLCMVLALVLVLGLATAGSLFASPAKSAVKKKTADLDSAVSFLKKHNKPEIVGKVITALKKEGYSVTQMIYGSYEPFDGFSVSLKGRHDVEILCEVPGLSNRKREKQLGISRMKEIDSFSWENGKFQSYPGKSGSAAHWQKVLQKILGNFTVTSVSVDLPLPKNFSWGNKKVVWECGNNVIQKLQPKLGKPTSKGFSWEGDECDGWYAGWGKPTKYEFFCNRLDEINELRVVVEEAKAIGAEDYDF